MTALAPPTRIGFWHPARLLATWFGAGLAPWAPGTVGSLVALPLAWAIRSQLGLIGLAAAVALVFALGVWAAGSYGSLTGKSDAGPVVIDEVAGQWLTLILVPPEPLLYAVGFGLFRAADIIKPWPISLVDKRLKGGFGVMFDDILAGVLAAIILWNLWIWLKL